MNIDKNRSVYFIGIGGIGMSALARWFLAQKWSVAGSDLEASSLTAELAKEGVSVKIGAPRRIPGHPAAVIRTNAIPPSNLELLDAERRGIEIFSYPQMVGEVSRGYKTIAIAGAHGKSTTTGLMSLVLLRLGLDPTILVGTKLRELDNKNFRAGAGSYLVLEADEYARAFLNYSPSHLIVTNIDREHLDIYKDLADIKKTFLKLFSRVLPGGSLVLNADDKNVASLRVAASRIAKKNKLNVVWYSRRDPAAKKIAAALRIPGAHNVSNALAVFTLATKILKLPPAKVLNSLGEYHGSWRRYEHKGSYSHNGTHCEVFDDYAHHPTEIKATLAAFREKFPKSTLVCVFQPHQAQRLKKLFKDFLTSFKDAHALILVPAYHVAGREKKESVYTAETLAKMISKKYPRQIVRYLSNPGKISRDIVRDALLAADGKSKNAVVVMMGAGTIVNYTPLLLK